MGARRAAIPTLVADLEDGLTAAAVAAAVEVLDPETRIPDLYEATAAYSQVQEDKARSAVTTGRLPPGRSRTGRPPYLRCGKRSRPFSNKTMC